MKLLHHDRKINFDDAWLAKAGMETFVPNRRTNRVDHGQTYGLEVLEVTFDEVPPVNRNPGVPLLVKKRVLRILRGFVANDKIPPVKIVPEPSSPGFNYKLVEGTHRFYCSWVAGFSHVPAIIVNWNTIDQ